MKNLINRVILGCYETYWSWFAEDILSDEAESDSMLTFGISFYFHNQKLGLTRQVESLFHGLRLRHRLSSCSFKLNSRLQCLWASSERILKKKFKDSGHLVWLWS